MKRITRFKKRTWVLLGVVAVIAAMASVGAYAYWTTTGSGTGTATVGTSTAVTIAGTSVDAVTPGGQTAAVSFTVTNPGSGPQQITQVQLASVLAFSDAARTIPIPVGVNNPAQCDTSQFSMAPVNQNFNAPTGGPTPLPNGGTLVLANDLANNQDGCKNAYLTLNLTSS
jgi:hypothetical protein